MRLPHSSHTVQQSQQRQHACKAVGRLGLLSQCTSSLIAVDSTLNSVSITGRSACGMPGAGAIRARDGAGLRHAGRHDAWAHAGPLARHDAQPHVALQCAPQPYGPCFNSTLLTSVRDDTRMRVRGIGMEPKYAVASLSWMPRRIDAPA